MSSLPKGYLEKIQLANESKYSALLGSKRKAARKLKHVNTFSSPDDKLDRNKSLAVQTEVKDPSQAANPPLI